MSSGRAEGQPGVCALPGHPVGSVHLCLVSSRELETLLQAEEATAGSLPGLVSE